MNAFTKSFDVGSTRYILTLNRRVNKNGKVQYAWLKDGKVVSPIFDDADKAADFDIKSGIPTPE